MLKSRNTVLVAILSVVLFLIGNTNACNSPISVTPVGTLHVAFGGGSDPFFVNTGGDGIGLSCNWSATSSSFISVSPFLGGGGTVFQFQVNVAVKPNPDLAPRTGFVTFKQDDGSSATVPVAQDAATGSFQLFTSPSSQSVPKGGTTTFGLSIVRSGGFNGTVFLRATGQPTGVQVNFNPGSAPGSSSTISVAVGFDAPTGNFPLVIIGQNGNVTQTTTAMLIIQPVCGSEACATMQTDGNFVVYGQGGNVLWSTGTAGTNAEIVRVQDDGNLVLYTEVWQAGTYATPSPGPFRPQTCSVATLLHAPQSLTSGQCIISPKGQYILYMAPDGNFYIYDIAHNVGTWGANTAGNPGAFALLQLDGSFVVRNSSGSDLWNSGTSGSGSDLLNMEDDGRIILYRPVWQSGTSQGWSTVSMAHPQCDVGPGTGWTGVLGVGQCFVSPNGRYELLLESGGLVLFDLSLNPPAVLWQRP